ncbi:MULTISPECIES: hypothetical protein [unclassified Sinorhizobium]|uniref:hypothetical protein n=1 Tax=unclassified Sinorhizobium TaxID=2613772 RepID=UPI0024C2BA92|nr:MULTISPECIES: hypothetical protein [unclassified Sinorhizobium]MDK1372977.1 hypothetical protein [Sinorhizobium sp. 6-70]MDK1477464.1 hypothetical protein [Sinorhizobium sp. 6-117]
MSRLVIAIAGLLQRRAPRQTQRALQHFELQHVFIPESGAISGNMQERLQA